MNLLEQQQIDEALKNFNVSEQKAKEFGDKYLLTISRLQKGSCYLDKGNLKRAKFYLKLSQTGGEELNDTTILADCERLSGRIIISEKKSDEGKIRFAKSIHLSSMSNFKLGEAEGLWELGKDFHRQGNFQEALYNLGRALDIFDLTASKTQKSKIRKDLEDLILNFLFVLEDLGKKVEQKDKYTIGHSQRVTKYSQRLAFSLGLGYADVVTIVVAAFLHDIGKLEISGKILNKTEELTPSEFSIIKRHPKNGERVVKNLVLPWNVTPAILLHHESYDGSGYPSHIFGDNIPIHARIIKVADVFDALTSERSYREAWTHEHAIDVMKNDMKNEFDPLIVNSFYDSVVSEITGEWRRKESAEFVFEELLRYRSLNASKQIPTAQIVQKWLDKHKKLHDK